MTRHSVTIRGNDGSPKEVEVNVTILRETTDAYYVDNGMTKAWVAKSLISDYSEDKGKIVSIILPEWAAHEKGLI